jgi:hypothetical protein
LGTQLSKGVGPDSDSGKAIFHNKPVRWEGTLKRVFKGEAGELIILTMEPIQSKAQIGLFPGGTGSDLVTLQVNALSLTPSKAATDAWKKLAVGTKVRFRANTGTNPVIITALTIQRRTGPSVFLAAVDGEVIEP